MDEFLYSAKVSSIGNFMVRAERFGDKIEVTAIDGRGVQGRETFLASESKILDKPMLQSYCEAILAQWRYHTKHGIYGGAPWPTGKRPTPLAQLTS